MILVKHAQKELYQSEEQQRRIFSEQVLSEDLEENQELYGETHLAVVMRSVIWPKNTDISTQQQTFDTVFQVLFFISNQIKKFTLKFLQMVYMNL